MVLINVKKRSKEVGREGIFIRSIRLVPKCSGAGTTYSMVSYDHYGGAEVDPGFAENQNAEKAALAVKSNNNKVKKDRFNFSYPTLHLNYYSTLSL